MSQTAHKILLLAVLLLPLGIVACASSEDGKQVNYSMTAKQNYERGLEELLGRE